MTVTWDDLNNMFGLRPDPHRVGLFQNNLPYEMRTVHTISENLQIAVFNDVPIYDSTGDVYVYTLVQMPFYLDDYFYSTSISGFTIINKLKL